MADIKSPEERSRNMSLIKGKDTKPEVYLRKLLFFKGYRYRKNYAKITGCPDIWMAKYNTAIFVHGCYWHRHPSCRFAYVPKSNVEFWTRKFDSNILRDAAVKEQLASQDKKCLVIWECTIKKMRKDNRFSEDVLSRIEAFLIVDNHYLEL